MRYIGYFVQICFFFFLIKYTKYSKIGSGAAVYPYGYGDFLSRLIGYAIFGATFNLVTLVGLPSFLEQ